LRPGVGGPGPAGRHYRTDNSRCRRRRGDRPLREPRRVLQQRRGVRWLRGGRSGRRISLGPNDGRELQRSLPDDECGVAGASGGWWWHGRQHCLGRGPARGGRRRRVHDLEARRGRLHEATGLRIRPGDPSHGRLSEIREDGYDRGPHRGGPGGGRSRRREHAGGALREPSGGGDGRRLPCQR